MAGGKTARRKGHNFEREVAIMFRPYFPDAKRQLEYQEGLGYDIQGTGDLSIQCKVGKSFKIEKALKEAEQPNKIPVAITKKDREDIVVSMYWKDFEFFLISYLDNKDKIYVRPPVKKKPKAPAVEKPSIN
jgi:hypothetical protein